MPLLRYVSETKATVWGRDRRAREVGGELEGPHFDNQVGTLHLDGRSATARLDKTVAGEEDGRKLEKTFERRLA